MDWDWNKRHHRNAHGFGLHCPKHKHHVDLGCGHRPRQHGMVQCHCGHCMDVQVHRRRHHHKGCGCDD